MYAICCYAAELTQSSALALTLQPLLHRKLPAWVYSHIATSTPWNGCESQMVPAEIYPFSSLVILQAGKCIGCRAPTSRSFSGGSALVCHRPSAFPARACLFSPKMHTTFAAHKTPRALLTLQHFLKPTYWATYPLPWSASQFSLIGELRAGIKGTVWP